MLRHGRVRLPGQPYSPRSSGAYVYGDFCTGRIWALRYDGSRVTEQAEIADTDLQISSFAEGPDGEVYILSFTGEIARLALLMEVRQYRASDHEAVWELHNVALNEVGAHAGNGPWDDDLHHIEAEYLDAGGEFYVGTIDGRIVAMGALKRLTNTTAEICRMRVHPDFQRRGLGTRILSRLEERARELGFRTLTLETTAGTGRRDRHVHEGRVR